MLDIENSLELKRIRICTLEFQNGVRVAVEKIDEYLTSQPFDKKSRVRAPAMTRFETCAGQPVVPIDDRTAVVMTEGNGAIEGTIVENEIHWGA